MREAAWIHVTTLKQQVLICVKTRARAAPEHFNNRRKLCRSVLTYRRVHLLCYELQPSAFVVPLTPLRDIPQQQRVSSQPLQRRHQQVAQLQPSALLAPLAPLRRKMERTKNEEKSEVKRLEEVVIGGKGRTGREKKLNIRPKTMTAPTST